MYIFETAYNQSLQTSLFPTFFSSFRLNVELCWVVSGSTLRLVFLIFCVSFIADLGLRNISIDSLCFLGGVWHVSSENNHTHHKYCSTSKFEASNCLFYSHIFPLNLVHLFIITVTKCTLTKVEVVEEI